MVCWSGTRTPISGNERMRRKRRDARVRRRTAERLVIRYPAWDTDTLAPWAEEVRREPWQGYA